MLDNNNPRPPDRQTKNNTININQLLTCHQQAAQNLEFMTGLNFVAIDFETANSKRMSACSVGLVVVENGIITNRIYHLIKPTPNKYDYKNTIHHGISSRDTEDKPTFDKIWKEIEPVIRGQYIVTHNAGFDISVITQSLDYFKLNMPPCYVVCTEVLSRSILKLSSFGLEAVVKALEIPYENHHHALYDAEMAANVLLSITKLNKSADIPTLLSDNNIRLGSFSEKGYKSCVKKRDSNSLYDSIVQAGHTNISGDALKKDLTNADPDHILYDKAVVITGVFDFIDRDVLAAKLKTFGADINTSISKKTNFVVMGSGAGPSKMQKIEKLQSEGYDIRIINAAMLKNIIDN